MFKGGTVPDKFRGEVAKWGDYVRLFLFCAEREHGGIPVSPYEIMEWPYRFFLVLSFVQQEYVKHVKDQHEKMKRRSKSGKGGKRRGRV